MNNPHLPNAATIIERRQDVRNVFTLKLAFCDNNKQQQFQYRPGQFNMLYCFGLGEVAISIVGDPQEPSHFFHTIRAVGQVTRVLEHLQPGDSVGIRGPYGHGWPLEQAKGKDVIVLTGGLGCAPAVSAIDYMVQHRDQFGRLMVLQGVKHSDDLLFRQRYVQWQALADVQVLLAADQAGPQWPFYTGFVTELIDQLDITNAANTLCMMCGPEGMMQAALKPLLQRQVPAEQIHLNLERQMKCAVQQCGRCMFGGQFFCRQGPVFAYPVIQKLFNVKGF